MHTPVGLQLWRLSILLLLGSACNIFFHIYTAFRAVFTPNRLYRHLLDIVTGILFTCVLAAVVFMVNYGEIRLYIFVSFFSGFFTCHYLVGQCIYRSSFRGFVWLKNLANWFTGTIISPFKVFAITVYLKVKRLLFPTVPPSDDHPPDETR